MSLSAVSHRIRLAHLPKHSRKSLPPRAFAKFISQRFRYGQILFIVNACAPLPPSRSRVRGDKAVRQAGRKRQRVCVCHLHTDATKGNKIATRAASSGGNVSVAYFQAAPPSTQKQVRGRGRASALKNFVTGLSLTRRLSSPLSSSLSLLSLRLIRRLICCYLC